VYKQFNRKRKKARKGNSTTERLIEMKERRKKDIRKKDGIEKEKGKN
jgi:hypothetical protein